MMIVIVLPILSVIFQRAACQLPQISLSSSLDNGQRVCPGDEIRLTCLTNGTASHAWTSDEYIGRGGRQLEFASFDNPGDIRRNVQTSPMGTFARLTAKLIEENETIGVLESEFIVVATSGFQTTNVDCVYVDTGIRSTASFQLLDAPGIPQDVEIIQRPTNGDRCDFSIQFMPPVNSNEGDIQYYNVTAFLLGQQIRSGRIIGTSGTFFVPVSNCTTDLRVRVQAVNRCDMPGNITADIVPMFQQEAIAEDTGQDLRVVLGVTIPSIIVAISLVAVVVIIIIVKSKPPEPKPQEAKPPEEKPPEEKPPEAELPPFRSLALKSWEWPGDEATRSPQVRQKRLSRTIEMTPEEEDRLLDEELQLTRAILTVINKKQDVLDKILGYVKDELKNQSRTANDESAQLLHQETEL